MRATCCTAHALCLALMATMVLAAYATDLEREYGFSVSWLGILLVEATLLEPLRTLFKAGLYLNAKEHNCCVQCISKL